MMKTFFALLTAFFFFLSSCATTVDMEDKVQVESGSGRSEKTGRKKRNALELLYVPIEQEPEIIRIEKPVYIPESSPVQTAGPTGRGAVESSNRAGILKPEDYSRATMIYDYDRDYVYEVYTQPLRASDIRLEAGEKAAEEPFISDSERWILGAGVSYERGFPIQHIYVKPSEAGLEASLIINTDRRVYHIILKSFRDVHMPMVRWRYPGSGFPRNYIRSGEEAVAGEAEAGREGVPALSGGEGEAGGVNPEHLSFNYRVRHGVFQKPAWLPELVYDDGKKTYISFPPEVLPRLMPAVFENRSDVLNYRVSGRVIIIDKLIERITVKIEREEITIEKKRG